MDQLLEKLLTTGGPLAVLVIVVYLFLRFIREVKDVDQVTVKEIHKEHLDERTITRGVIERNTQALIANTVAMESLSDSVRSCPLKVCNEK